jgi:uncharacterized protein (UPF0210 family)
MKEKTPYLEALRYMSNAKETLEKAKKDNGNYKDIKYVQTACGTAYNGVLIAIDEYLKRKEGLNCKKCKSIEEYRTHLSKQNKQLLNLLNSVYDDLHLAGYYHGTPSAKTVVGGMINAKKIIDFIKD